MPSYKNNTMNLDALGIISYGMHDFINIVFTYVGIWLYSVLDGVATE